MNKSNVYYCDLHTGFNMNLLQKLKKLMLAAGIKNIDFQDKFAAIKIHFGEPGNLAYLRPNYAKVMADLVKELGGKPFLTDCNTLYVGRRKNALDHLDAAYENGFNPFATGCHCIIADGLKGTDETLVAIDGDYVKEAKIGTAIMDADIFLTLTHFKGHEETGFGGTLKNIGMGCGSRAGKMEMHYDGKPVIDQASCIGCHQCAKICGQDAIAYTDDNKAMINYDRCVGCGRCIGACNVDAISPDNGSANDLLNKKIAEYAYAVIKDRPNFHVSLVIDVSPNCDCHDENDLPIIGDVGMFASFDPIALDQACADMANQAPVIPDSVLDHQPHHSHDHFINNHPDTDWRVCLEHGEKLGMGIRAYNLIKID